jgi:hypothetical protein
VLSLNWARIHDYGPQWWGTQPYFNFAVELILYGIIFWVVTHWYVERRDRARWTAKFTGEETTSSDHDILTERRLVYVLLVAVSIFALTVPLIEADIMETKTKQNKILKQETLFTKPNGIAISPCDYFSHDMIFDEGMEIFLNYECTNLLDVFIFTDQQYENYLKSSRSSMWIFEKNDTHDNLEILSEIFKESQSTILSWIQSNWSPELELLSYDVDRGGVLGKNMPEDGRYWFVLANAYNSTTAFPSEFTVTEYWEEYETVTERVRVGRKTMTLFELIFDTR